MGILSDDQAADLRSISPAEPKVVSSATLRKRAQRARAKAEREGTSTDQVTMEMFQQRHRDAAGPTQIATLLARQERVFDLHHWMEHQIDGSYNDPASEFYADPNDESVYVGLENGTADLRGDIAEHRTVGVEVYLTEFWKNKTFTQELLARGGALADFVRFGIITAVASHRLYEFENWLAERVKP